MAELLDRYQDRALLVSAMLASGGRSAAMDPAARRKMLTDIMSRKPQR